jgi:hypothetical protein
VQDGSCPPSGDDAIPTVRNFRFSNVRVKDVPVLVDARNIHPDKPLDGFSLADVTGTCGKGIALANIKHSHLSNIHVTGYAGPLLPTINVAGSGLPGAVAMQGPKLPDPVKAPDASYQLK